mmetsp:Transcript_8199/g.21607  ORF Transcript_8199/g.21607 Transcript_8199/m.21607 type:complete len:248 (-) Transcript_8199:533-1276(-)
MRMPFTRCVCCCSRMFLRSSLRWASATYSGLLPSRWPFISDTALVASSVVPKQTKPKPLELPLSSDITLADEMLPNCSKASRSFSSLIASSRFLMYRLTPENLLARSILSCSNLSRSSRSRSRFFCARPTYSTLPFCSLPLSSSTALDAWSCSSKLTKPKPRALPSVSFMAMADLMGPNGSNMALRPSSSTSSGRFFTKMFVKTLSAAPSVPARSLRGTKTPTKTFLPLSSMPLTLFTAWVAPSWVS